MLSGSVKVIFNFPSISPKVKNKKEFIDLSLRAMKKNGDKKYTGYINEKKLRKDLLQNIGNWNRLQYELPSSKQKGVIEKTIIAIVEKCQKNLPHPDLPIFVFIYPWFPKESDRNLFGGTTAFASYRTMHIFIDLGSYTQEALAQTIAHEWNHLIFYRYHPTKQYMLKEHMVMEGLAEVFREEIMSGKPAAWSTALTAKKIQNQFRILQPKLNTKSMKLYKQVFSEGKKYERWTGYSIGYSLAKKFRRKNPKLSWEDILKTETENILRI